MGRSARRPVVAATAAGAAAAGLVVLAVLAVGLPRTHSGPGTASGAAPASASATSTEMTRWPPAGPATPTPADERAPRARNVVLLIGDGMGEAEIEAARAYQPGPGGLLAGIDRLDALALVTVRSLTRDGADDLVADSAASGTAIATGRRTVDRAISVDREGRPLRTLVELAAEAGMRTGSVTTAAVQDATAAVQVAHVVDRACDGPASTTERCPGDALENGGSGSISEQLLAAPPDLTLGGGADVFAERARAGRWEGLSLHDQARERGFRIVTDEGGLADLRPDDLRDPVLGLFAPGHLAVEWSGPAATPDGGAETPARCGRSDERPASQPTLEAMTRAALTLLDGADPAAGFFLQVEGASIDKRAHRADPCGQIGETLAFDRAVRAALDFAAADGDTLVVVTADHAQATQIVPSGATTAGLTRSLRTEGGGVLTVSYATTTGRQEHTGGPVRVTATGPGAARVVALREQVEVFGLVADALRLTP